MKALVNGYFRLLEATLVLCLAAMCVMVFGNVVLRHFFDSGINVSEELSRFLFIWLTFLGATVAMRHGEHLGVDVVARRLPARLRTPVAVLAHGLVVACCGVFLWGLLRQHDINVANTGLVTGIPLAVVYSAAYLCAASVALLALLRLVACLRHGAADAEGGSA